MTLYRVRNLFPGPLDIPGPFNVVLPKRGSREMDAAADAVTLSTDLRYLLNKGYVEVTPMATPGLPEDLEVALGSGDGDGTVIEDGGTIGGNYASDVFCRGDVTQTEALIILGSLYVDGTLTNRGGFAIEVTGNVVVTDTLDCSPDSDAVSMENVRIRGNLDAYAVEFGPRAGFEPYFYVHGNYTVDYTDGSGADAGASGAGFEVGGSLLGEEFRVDGADADADHEAGHGGYLYVVGSCGMSNGFRFVGGGSEYEGQDAGDGGYVEIGGGGYGGFEMNGGSSSGGGDAGDGGEINLEGGYFSVHWLSCEGGNCSTPDPECAAGEGGELYGYGNIMSVSSFQMSGGQRTGAVSDAADVGGAEGGSVYVYGDFSCWDLYLSGGDCDTSLPTYSGGNGGSIYVSGNATFHDLVLNGGSSAGLAGGDGGQVNIYGSLRAVNLNASGGDSTTSGESQGEKGLPGSVAVSGGLQVSSMVLTEGDDGTPAVGAAHVEIGGFCHIDSFNMTDSPDYQVQSRSSTLQCTLRIGEVLDKNTLNQSNGDQTATIDETIASGGVFTTVGGNWFAVAGVSLAAGE